MKIDGGENEKLGAGASEQLSTYAFNCQLLQIDYGHTGHC